MRLKKLEVYGFKSFAEKTQVVFENGITGIVGPNGCGKSNISDAVRWVLGEQSARLLRGTKMEDVIFNGTEKRRRLSYCEVTLLFENEDRALPIDFSEVAITRRVYRSGESEYQINKAPCRLRDVVDLFRDTGIGKEGYSLIGQGRIDEILSAKSEDRRLVFEEAAGIMKYKVRRNDAERRLENTRQNLTRVEDILSELESRIEPLRLQSEAAREYLQLREELKTLEINTFLIRSERFNQRIGELRAQMEEMLQALNETNEEQAKLTERRESRQSALSSLEAETARAREQVQAFIQETESKEGSLSVLRERISADLRERERLEEALSAAKSGRTGVRQRIDSLNAQIQSDTETVRSEEIRLNELAVRRETAERDLSQAQARSEELKTAVIDQINRLGDVRSEQARLEAMREGLKQRAEALESDEAVDADKAQELRNALENAQQNLARERLRKEELDALSARAVLRVREFGEKTAELSERITHLSADQQDKASRLRVLREMQRDYEGYQFSVRNVLKFARQSGGANVHGVVANVIRVPQRLERAIEMSLGSSLQNIIVDREEDASRMIDYLRKNRMGRATFLPLSAVHGRTLTQEERGLLKMPGCVGLASDLIDYDPVYRGVVENLLGRTVIAENLDTGIRIMRAGRYAFRLVTLEGDVMNPGGSMTGGSVQSRMTSLLSREREIDEHTKALAEIEAALQQAKQELAALEQERAELKQTRASLFDQLHQQEIACAREEAHVAASRNEWDAYQDRAARIESARAQLSAQAEETEQALRELTKQQNTESGKHESSQKELAGIQKSIVTLQQAAQSAQNEENDARVSLTAKQRDLAALVSERDRLLTQTEDMTRLLADNENDLKACQERLSQSQTQLAEEENAWKSVKEELVQSRSAFDRIDSERTQTQQELREIGEALDDLRKRSDDFTDRAHRSEVHLGRIESDLTQMTNRIFEDYELTYETALPLRDESFKLTDSEKRIAEIRKQIKAMGSVNVAAVDEYRETNARYTELSGQRDDLIRAQLDLQGIIDELVRQMEKQFSAEFSKMNANFQETFVKLFGGGKAELRLSDPKDALNCGIDIVAQPPGKKLQLLSLLSGGERALTAIAILFAMLKLKPTPFCFLDEIEAALDDANIDNYADYLKEYSRNTQFVVVTHRKGTMERCDALYGVSMEEKGVTRLMSIRLKDAIAS